MINLVDKSLRGLPERPPFSSLFLLNKFFLLLSVVLVRITPSILYSIIRFITSWMFFSFKSGEIFKRKAFLKLLLSFICLILESNSFKISFLWNSLSPCVLGEDILMVI